MQLSTFSKPVTKFSARTCHFDPLLDLKFKPLRLIFAVNTAIIGVTLKSLRGGEDRAFSGKKSEPEVTHRGEPERRRRRPRRRRRRVRRPEPDPTTGGGLRVSDTGSRKSCGLYAADLGIGHGGGLGSRQAPASALYFYIVESSPAQMHLQHFGEFVDEQVDQPHFPLHVWFVFQTPEVQVLKSPYLSPSSEISNAFVLVLVFQQALLLLDHHPRGLLLLLLIAHTEFDLLERKPWPPNFFPFPPGSFVNRFLNTKFRSHAPMFTTWN
ncbi:hypothetical protein M5K25_007408 [Dendrobium thyrsiflorum]|uniref:Uncharacterized protein n=1 Tax=Dendrobium thyrsiflorum TaxID=117978 RepID=A0ABD0VEA3_DENTH